MYLHTLFSRGSSAFYPSSMLDICRRVAHIAVDSLSQPRQYVFGHDLLSLASFFVLAPHCLCERLHPSYASCNCTSIRFSFLAGVVVFLGCPSGLLTFPTAYGSIDNSDSSHGANTRSLHSLLARVFAERLLWPCQNHFHLVYYALVVTVHCD